MRRGLAALAAALVILAGCSGDPEPPQAPPSPALWEVTGPDGAHGWLFGTAHALPDGYDWRTPVLDAAFADAGILAVEADLGDADPAWFADISTTEGLGRPSLRVDTAQRARVAAVIAKIGLSEGVFLDMESWAVALVLAGAFRFGESANGVDLALIEARDARPLVELEGYRQQLAVFDGLPLTEQLDMLEIVAGEAANAREEGQRQAEAWRTGDTATIEAAMATGLLADPELREALLTSRNRAWAGKIDGLLKDGGEPFVAVGLAHLLGSEGIPALLEARGYAVKRVQ